MLSCSALVASGLHAFVWSSVTGTRRSLDRKLSFRKSGALTIAFIASLNSGVLVCSQYLFQQSRYCGPLPPPAQFPPTTDSGRSGIFDEWHRAHRSANTSLPRSSICALAVSCAAPPGASFR